VRFSKANYLINVETKQDQVFKAVTADYKFFVSTTESNKVINLITRETPAQRTTHQEQLPAYTSHLANPQPPTTTFPTSFKHLINQYRNKKRGIRGRHHQL